MGNGSFRWAAAVEALSGYWSPQAKSQVLYRLGAILLGYLVASIGAGHVIALGFVLTTIATLLQEGQWQEAAIQTALSPLWIIFYGVVSSLFVSAFAFAPAVPTIVFAEIARIRSSLYYGAAGAIAAVVSFYGFAGGGTETSLLSPSLASEWTLQSVASQAGFAFMMVAAGFVGGLVYWRVAGKKAGDGFTRTVDP